MELEAVAKFVGYAGAIGGGAVACYTKLLKPMFNALRSNYRNLQAIPTISKRLDDIMGQLVPNGGSSLCDSVHRLEANQVIMAFKQGTLLNTAEVALVEADRSGRIIDVTQPLCAMLGRLKEELMGNNWISIIHSEDREDLESSWEDAVKSHRNFEGHFRFQLKDGGTLNVYMKMSQIPDYRGVPQGFVGTITKV